jgi:hypothetical protein
MSNVKSRVTRIKKKYLNHSPRFFYSRTAEEARITPITDHEKRNVERDIRNECVAVTRGDENCVIQQGVYFFITALSTCFTNHTDHEKRNVEREIRNECVAVTRGVKVRRNCNVFNLAMDNVFKGLPDKIRDQLSRHHAQMHFKTNALQMYSFLNHFYSIHG